ncbi:MAG TPA: amidohydrolase family protein, partial [Mycobacterium sp.]|nr:amidohydrolase family protein [Mycobacterium sp.]
MLIRRAILLDGATVDIRVDERILAVAETLTPPRGEQVYDAAGGTVIPGLHDHHVHLYSAAAALTSTRVGPAEVHSREDLARALAAAEVGSDGWIRGVGYHEAVAGPLDRAVLDEISPPVPVRIQHRSGVLWTLNSAGLARVGLADHPDGRLSSADRSWSDTLQRNETSLADVSRRLCGYGVTGVTDATPDLDAGDIVRLMHAHRRGDLRQRVHCLAPGKRILH